MPHSIRRVPNQRSQKSVAKAASLREQMASMQRLLLLAMAGFLALALTIASAVRADEAMPTEVPSATVERMQSIIAAQIDAFVNDDAEAAYAFAAEPIKMRFPTPGLFANMVQRGYPAVYSPQSFSFAAAALTPNGPAQQVEIVGEDGQVWRGLYTFAENEDGNLLISGVFLRRQNERQI